MAKVLGDRRQSISIRDDNWREYLSTLNPNNVHKQRTCDVFLMVEHWASCATAVDKFNRATEIDPTNSLKSINFDAIAMNIRKFPQDSLYRYAAQEALGYLDDNQEIPAQLTAELIKLQIVATINQDVALAQKQIVLDRDRETDLGNLVQRTTDAKVKDKKGKAKGKVKDKSKSKKGKGGSKVQEKVYDVCGSDNEPKIRPTSKLAHEAQATVAHEGVEVEPKHLFMVIVGFYDFGLIEGLAKLDVPITGVVELTKPSVPPKLEDEPKLDGTNSASHCSFKAQVPAPVIWEDQPEQLRNFWANIANHLDGDDGCPEYLNDTFHMTICLPDESFDEVAKDDPKHCLNVFAEIGSAIVTTPDIKRQHVNYVRNLKICPVGPKPHDLPAARFKTYKGTMNKIPPDCCNVPTITHGLVEEICRRVPDPPQIHLTTPPPSTASSKESSISQNNPKTFGGITTQIADILSHNVNTHLFLKPPQTAPDDHHHHDPTIDLTISTKAFLVQENNDLEVTANSYPKLTSKLLNVNTEKLVQNPPVLLWRRYPYNEAEHQKVLTKIHRLQEVADSLDLPMHELQYFIHTVLFNSFSCLNHQNLDQAECHCLQMSFPRRPSSTTPSVLVVHIPYSKPTVGDSKTSEGGPHVALWDAPNLYEAKNLSAYQWYESLSVLVNLQELRKAERDFLCLDYKYCTFDDSILLRYHNDVDEFGVSTTAWDQSLRTPIDTVREFCRYVVHVEAKWLEAQEVKYVEELEEEYRKILEEAREVKAKIYPDLVFTDLDFVQRGSIKGKFLEELQKPPVPTADPKGGKKNKGSKAKDKSSKATKATAAKGKGSKAPVGPPSQLGVLEKLSKAPAPPVRRKLSLRCAQDEEPFSFYAYDVSNSRVQLTGSTTTFHSQDGFKVTVDQARLIGQPRRLSLNICIRGHSLILHHNQASPNQPFTFHFALADGTVTAFAKPPEKAPPEEKLGERICQELKRRNIAEKPRQQIYFVSEKQTSILKCFSVPFITRKNLILSEDLMVPFLNQLSTRGIRAKLASTDTLSTSEISKFEEALLDAKSTTSAAPPKYIYDVISKRPDEEIVLIEEDQDQVETGRGNPPRRSSYESVRSKPLQRSNQKLVAKIRVAAEAAVPVFKICSSKFHRFHYVKRIKSHVEMQIGTVLRRIPCKPVMYRPKTHLEISRLLPVKPCELKRASSTCYGLRVCLPSGLLIESTEGDDTSRFNIRQRYLSKGPQCKSIAQEYSRTFMRNGNVLIKKLDGNIDVLGVGGQIVKCEIPYFKVKSTKPHHKRQTTDAIPLHMASLTKFQKQLNHNIKRLQRHLIDGYKSRHFISHKACQKWKKYHITDPHQVYILQSSVGCLKQFSLVTSDGKKLRVTPSTIVEEKKYYTSTAADYRYNEHFYGREDGTHSILNSESSLATQFPDGTRLTTWIDVDRETLIIMDDDQETTAPDNPNDKEQQVYEFNLGDTIEVIDDSLKSDSLENFSTITFESESKSEEQSNLSVRSLNVAVDDVGWVSVHLNVKYEHPNYATVVFYGKDGRCEVILPNQVTLGASHQGEYVLDIDGKISTHITTKEILVDSRLCTTCLQKSTNRLNIKPLYDEVGVVEDLELLRTSDSFQKVFIVNYGGQCFRSSNYLQSRTNQAGCTNHSTFQYQKLFVLTRSLTGCKLWDVDSYQKRVAAAKQNPRTETNEFGPRLELRTYNDQLNHEKFLIPYDEPTLVLTKNKPTAPTKKNLAYVTRQVLNTLPPIAKFYHIYSTLLDLASQGQIELSETVELKTFLSHVVDEILGKHEGKPRGLSVGKSSVEYLDDVPPKETKTKSVPFNARYKKWLESCKGYWDEIRAQHVPNYFNSKYNSLRKSYQEEAVESSSKLVGLYHCRLETEGDVQKADLNSWGLDTMGLARGGAGDFVKTVEVFVSTNKDHLVLVEPAVDVHFKMIASNSTVPELETDHDHDKSEVGKTIANKFKVKVVEIAMARAREDDDQKVSVDKVIEATKLLLDDLSNFVEQYTTGPTDHYALALVDKVSSMGLGAVELILLSDTIEQAIVSEQSADWCCPSPWLMDQCNSTYSIKPCKGDSKGLVYDSTTTMDEPPDVPDIQTPSYNSYFGVYGCYADTTDDVLNLKPRRRVETAWDKARSVSISSTTDVPKSTNEFDASKHESPPPEEEFRPNRYYEECERCNNGYVVSTEVANGSAGEPTELIFSRPSVDEGTDVSMVNRIRSNVSLPGASSCTATIGSEVNPNIEMSSEVSLGGYCLSDILETVQGSTVVLDKNEWDETESMMVMFSVASLRRKDKPTPGPYMKQNPHEVAQAMMDETKATRQPGRDQSKSDLETEPSLPLLKSDNLHKCPKCAEPLDEELGRTESLRQFKTKSVASLLAILKGDESEQNMSSRDKERMARSLMNIMENLPGRQREEKYGTVISDVDAQIVRDLRPKGSKTVLQASRRVPGKEAVRRSVGSQTQEGVADEVQQS